MRLVALGFLALASGCVAAPAPAPAPLPAPARVAAKPDAAVSAAAAKASGERVAPCSVRRAATQWIEDAEDGDGAVTFGPFAGGWFNYKDESGSTNAFGIDKGGIGGSKYAAHMIGRLSRAELIYAGMGISLGRTTFDASMYRGVAFRAKVGRASTRRVRFTVSDVDTEPAGGVCSRCYNHFGVDLDLTTEWADYRFDFEQLSQGNGWGDRFPALVVNALYSLGWAVTDRAQPFDVWVDDVALVGCD